jgi:hypothetical protein
MEKKLRLNSADMTPVVVRLWLQRQKINLNFGTTITVAVSSFHKKELQWRLHEAFLQDFLTPLLL